MTVNGSDSSIYMSTCVVVFFLLQNLIIQFITCKFKLIASSVNMFLTYLCSAWHIVLFFNFHCTEVEKSKKERTEKSQSIWLSRFVCYSMIMCRYEMELPLLFVRCSYDHVCIHVVITLVLLHVCIWYVWHIMHTPQDEQKKKEKCPLTMVMCVHATSFLAQLLQIHITSAFPVFFFKEWRKNIQLNNP